MTVQQIRKKTTPIFRAYDVQFAGLFGSYARGEQSRTSDVDIVVALPRPTGFIRFIGLENDLSRALHKKVDLVSSQALHPRIRPKVLQDIKLLYGKRSSL